MADTESPWNESILSRMEPGAVTFAWDDEEIKTVAAPENTLEDMKTAWEWIDARLREFEKGKGRPRSVCFRLTNGKFRGLRFPDWNTGAV
jgi:hypothetical protein